MSEQEQLRQIEVAGKPLRCVVCDYDWFYTARAQLNSAVATFFNLDWTNPTADCYICARCDYIHWFYPRKRI